MADRFRKKPLEENPIKHTAGGEMPDPSEQHHVKPDELEAIGGLEGQEPSKSFFNADRVKGYLPWLLGAVGIGLGALFIFRKINRGDFEGKSKLEEETVSAEGERALDIDDVAPSRLMGA